MFYNDLNNTDTNILPQDLLNLFEHYLKTPFKHYTNFILKEDSEEYIINNKILNTKKSDKTFSEVLFSYIDNSGLTEVEVYKKADINRRLFSKIKSNNQYHPSFGTITAFALALKLSTKEYEALLKSASYSLPLNSYVNITLKYCFDNKIYNLDTVNSFIYTVANRVLKDL